MRAGFLRSRIFLLTLYRSMIYCFGMKGKPSYQKLITKRQKFIEQLGKFPPVLRGSLRLHGNVCGNPACRCKDSKNPVRHGPYHYLSHRYGDKTQSIFLTKKKLDYAREWIDNYKRLINTIYELSQINFQLLRYHHDKLESGDEEGASQPEPDRRS
jgi:hypothetical protein